MALRSSISIWKDIEKLDCKEQKRLLQWQLQAREPIRRFSDMKAGDHLVRKGSSIGDLLPYKHHFICAGFNCEEKPKIAHYFNTPRNGLHQMFPTSLGSGTAMEQLGKVQEMTLPHEDFIKNEEDLQAEGKEVERVVWPEELRRYAVEEVIDRALSRLGESFYHPTQNNCESFVMWCMCDLNISLQVTPKRRTLCEAGSALLRSFWHGILQFLRRVGAELLDDVVKAIVSRVAGEAAPPVLPKVGLCVGAAVTVIIEAITAANDINNSYQKWKDGVLITSRWEFIKEVVDAALLGMFRSGGSIAGMVAGQLVIPIPFLGGFVGAILGIFGGQLFGKVAAETTSETVAQSIDSVIKSIEKDFPLW